MNVFKSLLPNLKRGVEGKKYTVNNTVKIAFEGLDGAGKTTVVKNVSSFLSEAGIHHQVIHEGSMPLVKDYIDEIHKKKELSYRDGYILSLLYGVERLYWTENLSAPIILMDRSIYSSLAYQAYLGVEIDWIMRINKHGILPDHVIFLNCDLDKLRLKKVDFFENEEVLKSVLMNYKRYWEDFEVIDANRPLEEVLYDVMPLIIRWISEYYGIRYFQVHDNEQYLGYDV